MQLTKRDVVGAAIAILDEYGLGDLTMRRLAKSLDVAAGALYWHFPNKQALLGAVADRMLETVGQPVMIPWDDEAYEVAMRIHDALLAHRDGAELVSSTYASRLTTSPAFSYLEQAISRTGLSEPKLAAQALIHYILGHTVDEQFRTRLDSEGAIDEPMFASPDPTTRFAYGLELFLDGVRAQNRTRT